jgi:hypothetical protein
MSEQPRTFDSLRRPVRKPDQKIERVQKAFAKVAMQPEGQLIFDWMRNRTTFSVPAPDASDGALRENAANRKFMAEIEGMIQSGGRRKSKP